MGLEMTGAKKAIEDGFKILKKGGNLIPLVARAEISFS